MIIKLIHNKTPIPIPATNNFPIDTLAMEPYKIIPIPGGINGVIIADVAVNTEENSLEYPFSSISGTRIFASIAASARLLPERPPINVDNKTFTCPRPPVIRFVTTLQKFIIRFVTPEEFIKIPAQMKNGIASNGMLWIPPPILCAMIAGEEPV